MINKIKLKIDSFKQCQIYVSYEFFCDVMKFLYIVIYNYDNMVIQVNYFCYINKYEELLLWKVYVYELDKNQIRKEV